jgi:hypothetical protein
MPVSLKDRKKALLVRSELLRRTLVLQLKPVQRVAGLAETGFQLARGLGALMSSLPAERRPRRR